MLLLQDIIDKLSNLYRVATPSSKFWIFLVSLLEIILSIKNSLQNYRSDEFIPKPNLSELYKNTKQLLGKEQMDLERL